MNAGSTAGALPRGPIGGGAADRAGAILARRLAKTVVAVGFAGECIATLAIFPGDLAFCVISLWDRKGAHLEPLARSSKQAARRS
jgi:hypothetical protein